MELEDLSFQSQRISDQVKEFLKRKIIDGKLKRGEKLPTEENLAKHLKVSKTTVREALSYLEAEGFVQKRRGAFGGNFVSRQEVNGLGKMIKVCYEVGSITIAEMTDMRMILEPVLAGLAAERRTNEDLKAMKECLTAYQRLVDNRDKKVFEKALLFHRHVANACHNPLISGFMEGLTSAYEVFYGVLDLAFEEQAKDLEFHKKCYEAILKKDAKRAIRSMREHLEIFAPILMGHSMAEKAFVGKSGQSLDKVIKQER